MNDKTFLYVRIIRKPCKKKSMNQIYKKYLHHSGFFETRFKVANYTIN